ncbi:uncharacterized protein DS421_4g120550 [Arachis hypogaea]|nr:uncharacterized protein DS421_4g120550 [Arachis hypogaea]
MSNTFKLQFNLKLELKRGNEESNPGGKFWSNTFKLQFKVKLELKRGNEKATLEEKKRRTRLSSSLRLNWSLNVEMVPWCISQFWRLTSSLRLNWMLNASFRISQLS